MRKLSLDIVPHNVADARNMILSSLEKDEIEDIKNHKLTSSEMHFTLGRYIRNSWSLWDTKTHLVQHFRQYYKIGHADDISSIILEDVVQYILHPFPDVPGDEWLDKMIADFHKHWKNMGCNEYGERIT